MKTFFEKKVFFLSKKLYRRLLRETLWEFGNADKYASRPD